jgi:hypothetical protein
MTEPVSFHLSKEDSLVNVSLMAIMTPHISIPKALMAPLCWKTPSPAPNLAPRGRTDNAQLHLWLPSGTMAAVQRWCAKNNYYLKDFIIEAIEERLKRGYPK